MSCPEGDGGEGSKKVTLRTSDGEEFVVDEEVAARSQTLKLIIDDGVTGASIPLENVTSGVLPKVIEYCEKHAQVDAKHAAFLRPFCDGTELMDTVIDEELNSWDAKFVNVDQATLFEIMLAANYLEIKSLLDLTCKTVADKMRGKSIKEIRDIFHIQNDYTPEEEEEVQRENQWAFTD
uniref:SKP1-like protein n=1 Tax=Anthurium amnicola TaxID=1678845 RepID=A0A1D1XIN7_9ARAE